MTAADRLDEALRRVAAARGLAREAADRLREIADATPATSGTFAKEVRAAAAELDAVDVLLADAEARCRRAAGVGSPAGGDAPPHAWPDDRLGSLAPVREWLRAGRREVLRGDIAEDFDAAVSVLGIDAINLFLNAHPGLPYADAWRSIVTKLHATRRTR